MKTKTNKFQFLKLCMVALTACLFYACNETAGGDDGLGFPAETLEVDVAPGDEVDVTFNVAYSWKINSNADWCRVNGEDKSFGGKAGEHTIKFVISDLGNLYVNSVALITLHMNDESRVIARITRRAKQYTMEVSDGEHVYADGESIAIGVTGQKKLTLRPDFDIEQLRCEWPNWIKTVREDSILTLNVIDDSLRYVINREGDSLRFFKDSTFYRSFHIRNKGQEIVVETAWGVNVSSDGTTYYDGIQAITYDAPWVGTVDALRGYELMCASYDDKVGCTLMTVEDSWLAVDDDRLGNLEVTFDVNDGHKRTMYLFALPQILVQSFNPESSDFQERLSAELFEVDSLLPTLRADADQYVVAEFVQESGLFSIQHGRELTEMDFTYETDAEWIAAAGNFNIPAEQVFRTQLEFGVMYKVNPKLSKDMWNPEVPEGAHIELWGKDGHQFEEGVDYKAEPALTEDELYYYMQLQVYLEEECVVYFVDDKGSYLKALVIEPIILE